MCTSTMGLPTQAPTPLSFAHASKEAQRPHARPRKPRPGLARDAGTITVPYPLPAPTSNWLVSR